MTHWKLLQDRGEYISACDLLGKEKILQIESVKGGELTGEGGKKSKKAIASFVGASRKLALNATNCKTLVTLSGSKDVEKWVGLWVTIYPTTTKFGGETSECIRIKPELAKPPAKGAAVEVAQ